jgi:hypothetical protein
MIENTVLLRKVEKVKNYLAITYNDSGKEHTKNVFDNVPGYNLLVPNKMVKLSIDKNDKGYWTIGKIEDVTVIEPKAPLPATQQVTQTVKEQPKEQVTDNKYRGFALSYAKDLVQSGIIPLTDIYNCAHDFEAYLNGTFKPIYRDNWIP